MFGLSLYRVTFHVPLDIQQNVTIRSCRLGSQTPLKTSALVRPALIATARTPCRFVSKLQDRARFSFSRLRYWLMTLPCLMIRFSSAAALEAHNLGHSAETGSVSCNPIPN